MRTKRYLLILAILCISLSLANCGKDGVTGPQGTTGEKGDQGLVGPAGPKGENGKSGSNIYSGRVLPSSTTGVVGDYYINTATGFLYGPKTATGWGTGYSLKGPAGATGATGTAGSKTWSGSGVPGVSLGSIGDFYLDKSSYLLYGPKTNTGWGVAINLRGPAGSANVIYSDWVIATTWVPATIFNTYHLYYDIAASNLTQIVLDQGMVIVYGKMNGYNPIIWPVDNVGVLPIILNYKLTAGGITYTDTWSAITSLRKIRIDFVNNENYYTSISSSHSFRYVIIPGGVHASAKHLNLHDYAEVKRTFHLID